MFLLKKIMPFFSNPSNQTFIIGLGNPGEKYAVTRHNAGWLFLDFIAKNESNTQWQTNAKIQSNILKTALDGTTITLVKPQTFMNKSGVAVAKLLSFYKSNAQSLIIIHDDVDLPLGSYKYTVNSGSAGHNGIKSLFTSLKTESIARIRIGIGKSNSIPTDAYVLQKFSDDELSKLLEIFPQIQQTLSDTIKKS